MIIYILCSTLVLLYHRLKKACSFPLRFLKRIEFFINSELIYSLSKYSSMMDLSEGVPWRRHVGYTQQYCERYKTREVLNCNYCLNILTLSLHLLWLLFNVYVSLSSGKFLRLCWCMFLLNVVYGIFAHTM